LSPSQSALAVYRMFETVPRSGTSDERAQIIAHAFGTGTRICPALLSLLGDMVMQKKLRRKYRAGAGNATGVA